MLTHWGRVTHICGSKLTIIGSDNGLSPDRRQAIIWTNAGLLSIEPLRTYFSENLIIIQQLSLKKMHVKMSSAKWRPSCLGLNVLLKKGPQARWWFSCYDGQYICADQNGSTFKVAVSIRVDFRRKHTVHTIDFRAYYSSVLFFTSFII